MDILNAVLLGILQGLTEFLPVSSSAHLVLGKHLLHFESPDLLFDVMLHVATLCVVLIFFRKRVMLLIRAFLGLFFKKFSKDYFEQKHFLWGIIIATIPTGVIGYFMSKYILDYMQATLFVGYALILTSILLILSDNFNGNGKLTLGKSFLIGIGQGLAVTPGISRSGTTIAVSVMLGIKREEAAEFSFLISVPAIIGAVILKIHEGGFNPNDITAYAAGMAAAFISGFLVVGVMLRFIRNAKLKYFAFYCLTVGVATVLFS